jgi:quercetin dioxygenase-like cupin family protein
MAIAVDIHIPGIGSNDYQSMIAQLSAALMAAPGFLAHAAGAGEGGVHIVELWRSEAEFGRFADETVAPLARAANIVPEVRIEELEKLVTPAAPGGERLERPASAGAGPVGPDEGESFRLGPLTILVKEDGSHTRQTLAVAEFRGKGYRIPVHVHTEHDETIHVLEGTIGVMLGERTFEAGAGTSFTIPIGVPHSLWNESEAQARFLNVIVPARYLDYFHEMALVARDGRLAPPEEMKRVMSRYGLRPVV